MTIALLKEKIILLTVDCRPGFDGPMLKLARTPTC